MIPKIFPDSPSFSPLLQHPIPFRYHHHHSPCFFSHFHAPSTFHFSRVFQVVSAPVSPLDLRNIQLVSPQAGKIITLPLLADLRNRLNQPSPGAVCHADGGGKKHRPSSASSLDARPCSQPFFVVTPLRPPAE